MVPRKDLTEVCNEVPDESETDHGDRVASDVCEGRGGHVVGAAAVAMAHLLADENATFPLAVGGAYVFPLMRLMLTPTAASSLLKS